MTFINCYNALDVGDGDSCEVVLHNVDAHICMGNNKDRFFLQDMLINDDMVIHNIIDDEDRMEEAPNEDDKVDNGNGYHNAIQVFSFIVPVNGKYALVHFFTRYFEEITD